MQEQKQGETYEEVAADNAAEQSTEAEGSENTKSDSGKLFGLPIKYVAIGAAVLVVLIIGVVVVLTRKSDDDDIYDPNADYIGEDAGDSFTEISVFTESGERIGFCYSTVDGESIISDDYSVVGYIDSAGSTPFYSESGDLLGNYTPESMQSDQQQSQPVQDSSISQDVQQQYTDDNPLSVESDGESQDTEVNLNGESTVNVDELVQSTERNKLLRQYGYTGDEIELADQLGLSTTDLVQSARKLHDKAAAESMIRMSKKSSKEFRTMKDNSIFCMGKITFEVADITRDDAQQYEGSYVVNADYSKCPTYGHQLFIKCKIANSFYAFMTVTPARWKTLPDNGNIVVRVDYTVTGNKNANMYIIRMTEVDTTELTVNPQDSGININDILSGNAQYKGAVAEDGDDITEGGTTW